jgi:integrase
MSKHCKRTFLKPKRPKTKLGFPDLDHSKSAVLDSLRSPESKRGYRHAIDEFIQWYCSEPRLSFNKVVVTRYRIFLENRQLAGGTINGRLAAVRRLAYEAADAGLLSPELAAGIRRVKGAKKLGVRLGNWLTAEEARRFWQSPAANTLKGKRDRAILAMLLGCGLRRSAADLVVISPRWEVEKWEAFVAFHFPMARVRFHLPALPASEREVTARPGVRIQLSLLLLVDIR